MKVDELERLVRDAPRQPTHAQRVAMEERVKMALYHRGAALLACFRFVEEISKWPCSVWASGQDGCKCKTCKARALLAALEGE